jgi:transposase
MIAPPSGVRVWLATGATDMRRGMNGLALQVQEALLRDPHAGDLYVFRGKRGKRTTFYIQFASVDDCLSMASVVRADTAGLSASARQRSDVHLHGRVPWPEPGIAELDVRSSLLRGHDARDAPDQPGRSH